MAVVVSPEQDQAAGLRRMMRGKQLQIISFVGGCPGVGRSSAIANIAWALTRQGKEVLVIDENSSNDDIAAAFGLSAQHDLLQVIQNQLPLDRVLLQPASGLRLLPAAQAIQNLGELTLRQRQSFIAAMSGLNPSVDVILIDSGINHPLGISPLGLAAAETVVVVSALSSQSITQAYSLIKKASHRFSRRQFQLLVTKTRNLQEGAGIFSNIAAVAAMRGVASLEYAGCIPFDNALREADRQKRSIFTFSPNAPAALSIRQVANDLLQRGGNLPRMENLGHFAQQLLNLCKQITPHYS